MLLRTDIESRQMRQCTTRGDSRENSGSWNDTKFENRHQARALGVAMYAWDENGTVVTDTPGELVVTTPMPSMPVFFWNDRDDERYRAAYFDTYPGVWRHGDSVTVTRSGSVVVHGRSDATMNRLGVRIGSADIYEVVERIPEIRDSLVVGVEQPDGGYWMPLFVQLADGVELTEALVQRIRGSLRNEVSPRHVPDQVIHVASLPRTLTGKRLEIPIKRLLQGAPLETTVNPAAIDNPQALAWFASTKDRAAAQIDTPSSSASSGVGRSAASWHNAAPWPGLT